MVRQLAQKRRAHSAQSKRHPEEQSRDHSHTARNQFLRIDYDRRERRRENQADNHAQHACPEEVRIRQSQRKRKHAENRAPDHDLTPDAVSHRSADDRAHRHCAEEREQMQFRTLNRNMEPVDQIKRVVAAQARQVKELGKHERQQHTERNRNPPRREIRMNQRLLGPCRMPECLAPFVPGAHVGEQNDGEQCRESEPHNAVLAARQDDECREQRPERRPRIPSDLKHRLRQSMLAARGHARHPRRLRMKDRRPHPDQSRSNQNERVVRSRRQQRQPHQRESHPERQRIWFRLAVGIEADQRLQQRRGELRS